MVHSWTTGSKSTQETTGLGFPYKEQSAKDESRERTRVLEGREGGRILISCLQREREGGAIRKVLVRIFVLRPPVLKIFSVLSFIQEHRGN